jgi:uncharacterized protein YjbJ (UPF0337 family)
MYASARTRRAAGCILSQGEHWHPGSLPRAFVTLHYRGDTMNKDQIRGRINEMRGMLKKAVGKAAGDKELVVEGTIQNTVGKVQAGVGDLKDDIKKSI